MSPRVPVVGDAGTSVTTHLPKTRRRTVSAMGAGVLGLALATAQTLGSTGCAEGSRATLDDERVLGELDASFRAEPVLPESDGGLLDGGQATDASADVVGDSGCGKPLVVNEIQVHGAISAADEFIELLNPGPCTSDVGGLEVELRSKSGELPIVLHKFAPSARLGPGELFVIGGVAFAGKSGVVASAELVAVGAQIGLVDRNGRVVDAVGYGASTSGRYVEGRPAPTPPAAQSVARSPGGVDSDDNVADFHVAAPTPGAPNN